MSLPKIAGLAGLAGVLVFLFWVLVFDGDSADTAMDASPAHVEHGSPAEKGDTEEQVSREGAVQSAAPAQESDAPGAGDSESAHPEPDWLAVDDVDGLIAELTARYEDGDGAAARHLATLAALCFQAYRERPERLKERAEEEPAPDIRQRMMDHHEILSALQEGCAESGFSEPIPALELSTEWTWKAADAGDSEAMYTAVFEQTGTPPEDWESEGQGEVALERRREYVRELRDRCHADSLHSMGMHMSRHSPVTEGLELGHFDGVSEETAQQMEAFAHRYAASHLRDEDRPAHAARHADFALTSAEEAQAMTLAEDILDRCD